jgi:hypothetical protein
MPDQDKRQSHAHLLPRVPMNTRRCAHGVRGRAKPSMIISAEVQKLLKTWLIKYYIWSTYLWSSLFFIRSDAHAESNRSCMERRPGALCFSFVATRV